MPPKPKDKVNKPKVGKLLKDFYPPNSKAPRDSIPQKVIEEASVRYNFELHPNKMFPEWPGNETARVD